MTDRTQEFFNTASTLVSQGVQPVSDLPMGKKTRTEEAKAFTQKSAEISKKIQLTSRRLMELAKLTHSRNVVDNGEEINILAARLKNDTKFLKVELDHLQQYLNSNKAKVGPGSNATDHSQHMIEAMQRQLMGTSSNFKTVLEEQQSMMQEKHNRRGVLGRSNRVNLSNSRPSTPPMPSDGLPRPQGVTSTAQTSNFYSNSMLDEDGEPAGPLIQPVASQVQDHRYLNTRADAMSSIESHIGELGDVFSQLSIMIAEQGSMVERIDENVATTHENINLGTEQLMETWNNVSNNKWLAAKLLAILLFFMTFFIVFVV